MHPTSRAPSPIAEGAKAMYTLSQTEVDLFYERGFHVAQDVFSDGKIARLHEGYDYILALAGRKPCSICARCSGLRGSIQYLKKSAPALACSLCSNRCLALRSNSI